jgi:hypothetical protein
MASEPFEATDDKGNTVTGTVDVYRDPKGPYFDPKSEYYMHPRYADAQFDYFNTRGACTIDRDALSKAMEGAFANALTRFGIENPGRAKIAEDVSNSINATRRQCILNADKYVSNETFSSSNWETGEAVGNLTAKAYAAVPAPDGGIQAVVARENSWPAADVLALKNYGTSDARVLSRRVIARDGGDGVENWGSSPEGIVPQNPTQHAPLPHIGGLTGISDSTKPMRYLSRRDGGPPPTSVFDPGAPAAQFVLSDQLNSFGGASDWAAVLAGLGPLNPIKAAPLPPAEETPGIASTTPGRVLSRRNFDKPQSSVFGTSKPAVRFAPSDGIFSVDRRNALVSGSDDPSLAGGSSDYSSMPEPRKFQGSTPPALLKYIQLLNQPSANTPQAPFAPSDSPSPTGGLAGRIAALAGIDPNNPDQPVPQSGGLLGLLLDARR